ncbi:MAG TPA: hypothetical protein VKW76_05245 [Candidatus Binatia bacterium]|nr:hypothetical protein [Candidatus Binatia bacterium]
MRSVTSAVVALALAVPGAAGARSACPSRQKSCYQSAKADLESCTPLCGLPGVDRKSCEKRCAKAYRTERQQCRGNARACRRGALRVTFQGAASYQATDSDNGQTVEQVQGGLHWTTIFDDVLVNPLKGFHLKLPGDFPTSWLVNPHTSSSDGSFDVQVFGSTPCQGTGGLEGDRTFPATLNVVLHSDGSADFTVQAVSKVVENPLGAQDCSDINGSQPSDFWQDWVTGFGHAGLDSGTTLTYAFTLTKELLAQGKIIVNAQAPAGEVPSTDCGSGDGVVCTQSYGWTGTVTLQRESTLPPGP